MGAQFKLSRRDLLLSLPALSIARKVLAQSPTKLKVRALNHMTIAVTRKGVPETKPSRNPDGTVQYVRIGDLQLESGIPLPDVVLAY